jgi:hypothetical protein
LGRVGVDVKLPQLEYIPRAFIVVDGTGGQLAEVKNLHPAYVKLHSVTFGGKLGNDDIFSQ